MSGEYADAYDAYIERAHFPLICPYALSGALGVVNTKVPEFNLPKKLDYLYENATKDGRTLRQLFLDIIVDLFQTGRVPLAIEPTEDNEFRFVQYTAESFINWRVSAISSKSKDTSKKGMSSTKGIILAVMKESVQVDKSALYAHNYQDAYRSLLIEKGKYTIRYYIDNVEQVDEARVT